MKFGTCQKCGAKSLPVENGQLIQHMGNRKPCDWSIPSDVREGVNLPYINNPSLNLFQNITTMLDLIEQ